MLERILPYLGLEPAEQTHLRQMQAVSDAKQQAVRHRAIDKIGRSRAYHQRNPDQAQSFEYLSRWYHVVIREMSSLPDFELNEKWIRKRLVYPLGTDDIRRALRFLKDTGFIERDKNGKWTPGERQIHLEGELLGLALREFHRGISQASYQAMDETPGGEHQILGYTFAVPQKNITELHDILKDSRDRIAQLEGNPGEGENVYHVTLMSAPLTQKE